MATFLSQFRFFLSHLLSFAYCLAVCCCTPVFHSSNLFVLIFFHLVAVVPLSSVSHTCSPLHPSLVARFNVRDDPPSSRMRNMDDFSSHLDRTPFAAIPPHRMQKPFGISCMVRSVKMLCMPGKNFVVIGAVFVRQN